jgi:uncharacterized protein
LPLRYKEQSWPTQRLSPSKFSCIAQSLNLPLHSLTAVIGLLNEGGTVPFIARYRKEATGNLDEVQIRDIEAKLGYFRDFVGRRETILGFILEQGKLTDELKARIDATFDKSELEDLYLPYRPKRRTKATVARDRGLEPLADCLWAQQPTGQSIPDYAATFINPDREVATVEAALEGARHIVAETISENADLRKALRQLMFDEGIIVSKKALDAIDEQEKFKIYYDYREPVKSIPSHRMLAIRRGETESVLYFLIELEPLRAISLLRARIFRGTGDWTPHLELAIDDSWKRLLSPSIQGELRLELKKRSDAEAIQVFRDNLQNLPLAAPAGPISVLGIDPGLRTGCKIAVVDETGKFLAHDVLYLHTSKNAASGAGDALAALIAKHNVRAMAIGNGTASRETDAFIREFLRERQLNNLFSVTVSESGASVYSASDIARQEFPDLDLTVRGAISIARRLQDPLSELVKVDPKSIGVGQYQHDVDQRQLQQSLETVIESCVNRVGVDLNTSSWTLLRYVAGVTERTALNIVAYRDEHGKFRSRYSSTRFLVSALRPSSRPPASFASATGRTLSTALPSTLSPTQWSSRSPRHSTCPSTCSSRVRSFSRGLTQKQLSAGSFTVSDILEELRKPGRDPRDQFVAPSFSESVREFTDVQPDMVLEGVVTNVTKFGAFVDIGVHQDGLVHISELSNRFIKDPSEAVKAGQIVKVKVLSADVKAKRIALSMKALMGPARNNQRPKQPGHQPPSQPSLNEKLATLSSKWRVS